ncbi:hypothetical protein ZYGR_0AS06760 [Zygosaccharomyces rouxii]|uniref:Globin domain-containing protein n=1 Tax=Zygosaccharomyces rouxii TaxID=4956 RepID=A0A1Q3AI89_ZYGRO|nr:hypothetical protein ZYGR_0AS06760 [Zygosaccharomyces rouxii]
MSSLARSSFYSPLDQSQLEFIPSDVESINAGDTDPFPRSSWASSQRRGSHVDSLENNSYGKPAPPGHLDEMSVNRPTSQFSEHSDVYTLSRMSTATSRSSLLQTVRYRIVLRLNPRERNLIRDSWAMILNDDSTNNIAAYSKIKHTQNKGLMKPPLNMSVNSPQKMGRFTTHSRQGSTNSNHVVEPKTGVRSNAFTSSLFCSQFYANLLSMEPSLEQIFPSTKHQAVAFAGVLTAAISNLENLQVLEAFLNGLGKRHSRILGIEPPHFELMGVAFLRTLQDRFGVHCTVELEDAWSKLYSYLANSILQFGIDPILHVRLDEDALELPIPNLVEHTPRTVIDLKQGPPIDLRSLGSASMSSAKGDPETISHNSHNSQFEDLPAESPSTYQPSLPTPVKNYSFNSAPAPAWRNSPATATATASSPTRKPTLSSPRRVPHKKAEARRSFARPMGSASNKDCVIM